MKLYFLNGPKEGTDFELVPPGICIGREVDNDIQLLVAGVSRYHAKIDYSDGKWILSDMGSTNGTKVNSQLLKGPAVLSEGMLITIGGQRISVGKVVSGSPEPEKKSVRAESKKPPEKIATPVEPEEKTMKISKAADISSLDIFGEKNPAEAPGKKENTAESRRKRLLNILFYVVLVCILAAGAKVGIPYLTGKAPAPESGDEKKNAVSLPQNSFYLSYEKKIISNDNIFRFYFELEKEKLTFVLDDLKHSRRFRKIVGNGDAEKIKALVSAVRDTGFMKLVSEEDQRSEDGVDRICTLCVGYENKLNTVRVKNGYAKQSFKEVEQAVDDLANSYGLRAISLSPQEMQQEAESSFRTAEDLFQNYQARPENLRNAILRYQIVVDFLESCDPHPRIYTQARQKLSEAEGILKKLIESTNFDINLYVHRQEYARAVGACNKLLYYLEPDNPVYAKTYRVKLTLEKKLAADRKKNGRK